MPHEWDLLMCNAFGGLSIALCLEDINPLDTPHE